MHKLIHSRMFYAAGHIMLFYKAMLRNSSFDRDAGIAFLPDVISCLESYRKAESFVDIFINQSYYRSSSFTINILWVVKLLRVPDF